MENDVKHFKITPDGMVYRTLSMLTAQRLFSLRGGTMPNVYAIDDDGEVTPIMTFKDFDLLQEQMFGIRVGNINEMVVKYSEVNAQ